MTSRGVTLSDEATAVRPLPTHAELERAITSVPGVEEAHVTLIPDTGKSRLRIRLAGGHDAGDLAWAISATLRERFGILVDPESIRPRIAPPADVAPAASVDEPEQAGPIDPDEVDDTSVVVIGDRTMLSEAARALLPDAVVVGRDSPSTDRPDDSAEGEVPPEDEPEHIVSPAPERGQGQAPPVQDLLAVLEEVGGQAVPDEDHDQVAAEDAPTPVDEEAASGEDGRTEVEVPAEASEHQEPGAVDELSQVRRTSRRAAIRHLDTHVDVSDVQVAATLTHAGRTVTGRAQSVPTEQGILRAVAEATVHALRELTGDRLVVSIDAVAVSVSGQPPTATVIVGLVTDQGEESLLGTSLVRSDPQRAVMRATLDALNRRVEPWLEVDLAS